MHSRNVVIGVVSSVLVVLAALGLLLALGGPGAASQEDIALPERVDGLIALDVEAGYPAGTPPNDKVIGRVRDADAFNSAATSEVFDDAAAATRAYADPADPSTTVTVTAVRADVGPLLPQEGFSDPQQLGLALPMVERVTRGDVECLLLRNQPPRAGTAYQPDQATPDAHYCQRRSGTLTVRVRTTSGDTDKVVGLVDDLWSELD